MTDAAKVAALREAPKPWHVWTYRPSSGAQECGNCGMPFSELAYSDPDRFPCAALSASDSGEVAGLRAILDIEEGYQPARLAAFLCQDAQDYGYDHGANPTLADFDARWPSCPRHQAMAANLFVCAALTRPVSETPEAPAARLSFPTPADASGGREGLRLRLTGEMLSEIDAMWPHAGAGPFAATVDWDEYEEFAATPPDLHPADASGGGEAEPTCRDCGLTREQIDWGWHSAPYEGQFAAALTRPVSETPEAAPSSETRLRESLERLDRGVTRATRHTDGMVAARTMHLLIAELLREGASDD